MIKWEELNNYIGKPVWDNEVKEWKVLHGYKRNAIKFYLSFTDDNWWNVRDIDKLEIYKDEVEKDVSSND